MYKKAVNAYGAADYTTAIELFDKLGDYKDSSDKKLEVTYQRAVDAFDSGDFSTAIELFTGLGDYSDASSKVLEVQTAETYQEAVSAFESGDYETAYKQFSYKATNGYLARPIFISMKNVGDIVRFGHYTWYVIKKTNNVCTLLCVDSVAEMTYNEKNIDITWEDCTLRSWLNNDFYNKFSDNEKSFIEKTHNSNPNNSEYDTIGGNDTEDYVFLLSLDEADEVDEDIRSIDSWWWLRSPGYHQNCAALVHNAGKLKSGGYDVQVECSVRPAINLKFD